MIWDGIPYLCSNKRKTAAFSKFGVIFGEEKSSVTSSSSITTVAFLEKIDELTWSFVVYNFVHNDC